MPIVRTPFYIELLDAAGKKATGYIGAVGAGETLESELLVNGSFETDPNVEWAHGDCAIASVVGGQSGNCLEITRTGGTEQWARQNISPALNQLLKGSWYVKSGTSGNEPYYIRLGNIGYMEGISSGSWVNRTFYLCVDSVTLSNYLDKTTATPGTMLFDEASVKRVTDPPSTAVHIVSSLNGTTRNWASIESGFDPNTITSWKIYDLAHPGFYLPSDGSTFNRGDFTNGNAFFWSSIDFSFYAGTEAEDVSLRQRIISAVDTRLKTILTTGGYKSNLGQHIFEWKTDPFQASEIDGLTYRDRTEERTAGCGIYDLVMPLEIEMISDSPAGIRKCLADLEKAIFVDETWGGLAWYTELRTNEMAVEKKEELFSASKIILEIEYQTGRGHPD